MRPSWRTGKDVAYGLSERQRLTLIMPPKGYRKSTSAAPNKTLVLDNGAYTLKAGLVAAEADPTYDGCSVLANCIARSNRDKRTYISSELSSCKDFGELAFRRPVEKGFIVNWEAEKAIWEHEFTGTAARQGLKVGVASFAHTPWPALTTCAV